MICSCRARVTARRWCGSADRSADGGCLSTEVRRAPTRRQAHPNRPTASLVEATTMRPQTHPSLRNRDRRSRALLAPGFAGSRAGRQSGQRARCGASRRAFTGAAAPEVQRAACPPVPTSGRVARTSRGDRSETCLLAGGGDEHRSRLLHRSRIVPKRAHWVAIAGLWPATPSATRPHPPAACRARYSRRVLAEHDHTVGEPDVIGHPAAAPVWHHDRDDARLAWLPRRRSGHVHLHPAGGVDDDLVERLTRRPIRLRRRTGDDAMRGRRHQATVWGQ